MSDTVQESLISVNLPTPELTKGEREFRAFQRLLPSLLPTHRGKYVAIHLGQVVDSDTEEIALIVRVQAKIGYVPIYVGLVTDSPAVTRIPHYRELRPSNET